MEAGIIKKLKVLRKTPIGYMLTDGVEEVFMHNNEALYELTNNDVVEVFLYYDSERRLASTMMIPNVTKNNPGWATSSDVIDLGVFVNIGINKGMLIPKDYLPYDKNLWPKENDKLFCILKEKGTRLIAKVVNNNDAKKFSLEETIKVDDIVKAYVNRINDEGYILYTENLSIIYLHKTQVRSKLHLGMEVEVKITRIDDRGIHSTMLENKENMIDKDKEVILNYLKEHKFIYEDVTPEFVLENFNMSKKAYKRALGSLYKERIIQIENNKYILNILDNKK
ncbi:MAG: hypothetical protein J6Y28_03615 [Acholeplasmatales bacterium]|nr:hypothetical protein [Acholeplasmatales bacterium]